MKETLLSILKQRSSLQYLLIALLILGFLGFLDATYLTILHYKNVIPPCTAARSCEVVLTSKYATMLFGIPTSLLGSAFYLAVIILAGLFWQNQGDKISVIARSETTKQSHTKDRRATLAMTTKIPSLLLLLTTIGLIIGIYLVYLQAFVIHAYCYYCLTSELIDFLLFDCAWWLWRRSEK